jgi:hypothetical protein
MSKSVDVRKWATAYAKQVKAQFLVALSRPFLGGAPESISWQGSSHIGDGAAGELCGEQVR